MQKGLIILMIIFAVLLFIVIFCLMRKSKISVKYGLIWFLAAIFYSLTFYFAKLDGKYGKLFGIWIIIKHGTLFVCSCFDVHINCFDGNDNRTKKEN